MDGEGHKKNALDGFGRERAAGGGVDGCHFGQQIQLS